MNAKAVISILIRAMDARDVDAIQLEALIRPVIVWLVSATVSPE